MKQTMNKTKMITMGLFTLCTMGLSQATFAGVKTENPAIEFKFIGKTLNQPVFQLDLNNAEAENYFISIKDENNVVLYSENLNVKDANFSRKYRLAINEDDLSSTGFGLKVEVTSAKTHKTQVYKISTKTSVKEDIIVAQL